MGPEIHSFIQFLQVIFHLYGSPRQSPPTIRASPPTVLSKKHSYVPLASLRVACGPAIVYPKAGGEGEDEMVGWHHRLDGQAFAQTTEDGEGQGSLVCCSPLGRKESDTTERLDTKIR